MAEPFVQQRRFPRIASHHAVLVKKLGDEGLEGFAHTTTVAVGGCSFVSDESLGNGSILELLMTIDLKVIKSRARVVYERRMEDGRSEIGVEFMDIELDDAREIAQLFDRDDEEQQ